MNTFKLDFVRATWIAHECMKATVEWMYRLQSALHTSYSSLQSCWKPFKVAVLLALPLTDFLAASFAWELFKEHATWAALGVAGAQRGPDFLDREHPARGSLP